MLAQRNAPSILKTDIGVTTCELHACARCVNMIEAYGVESAQAGDGVADSDASVTRQTLRGGDAKRESMPAAQTKSGLASS